MNKSLIKGACVAAVMLVIAAAMTVILLHMKSEKPATPQKGEQTGTGLSGDETPFGKDQDSQGDLSSEENATSGESDIAGKGQESGTDPAEETSSEEQEHFPDWVSWYEGSADFSDSYAVLKDREVRLYSDASCETIRWNGDEDWSVQDMVVKDVDYDGAEELILLVWKHGSYGDTMPFWVEENDNRLRQHIFIYSYDLSREARVKAIWMSSEIGFDITSIEPGMGDSLIVSVKDEGDHLWRWRSFGLKYYAEAEDSEIRLLLAGDNLIHLPLLSYDRSGMSLYSEIAPVIREADIAAINLETILVSNQGEISDYPRFGTPLVIGEALTDAGFDAINLANNHVLDKGPNAINTTVSFFREKEIPCFGARPGAEDTGSYKDGVTILEEKGIKVAFLGYTYGMNGMTCPKDHPNMVETFEDEERMIRQIDYARSRADVVVVYAHWGEEYETEPSEEQLRLAKFFAEQKVDVVIGSHPHVLQKQEVIKDEKSGHETIVYYSLGNFISGQDKEGTRDGGIADLTILKEADGSVSVKNHSMLEIRTTKSEDGYRVELK
ncbi:MAG: CapA family protein [Lachnospiraceae bacterium]|nr:CapA family protein [Lachnospiraceae bacterium]